MNKICTSFLVIFLLLCSTLRGQDDSVLTPTPGTAHCFSVDEIEQLLHMSFRDAYDMLDTKGYQMGFFLDKASGEHRDTIDGVVLSYSRMSFNDINDRKSALWLYTSQDGLSNVVEWERNMPGNCTLFPMFHQKGYVYDRATGIFRGSGIFNGEMEHYEVQYYEDSVVLRLTMKNVKEIDTFVTKRRELREASFLALVEEARAMTLENRYLQSLALLDSLRGNGPRVDSAVNAMHDYVVGLAETFYFAKLDMLVNNNTDLRTGIKCCDTLMLFSHLQDSVREIKNLLQKQLDGEIYRFSELHPKEYQEIVKRLEKLINDELSRNVLSEEQRLMMSFTILTRKENESSGKISVGLANKTARPFSESLGIVGSRLQRDIDELAHSDLIQPLRQHGVFVPTRDQLSADIRWHSYSLTVVDECDATNRQLASAVRYIDDHWFSDFDTVRTSFTQDAEVKVTGRVRKPTKRIYTFSVNEKRMGETIYTDIALTKFSTTGLLSWTPSILIPGLGTKKQGLYSTASARAIPFFLCTALAITGFVWENNGGRAVDRPTFEEGGADRPWHYKDMGYYLGYGAGAIAATIYINELVEGISCSIRNLYRSKDLRKRLKRGSITVQTENIRLQ